LYKASVLTLFARYIVVIGSGRVDRAVNYVKAESRIILIEAHLKILRCIVISEKHRAPFNVKDAKRRAA
jgi:hypothetical protein